MTKKLLIILSGYLLFSCNKATLQLPEVNPEPATYSVALMHHGSKMCDLQFDRFNYRDSNSVFIRAKNHTNPEVDSVYYVIYHFRSGSELFDSVEFAPKLKPIVIQKINSNNLVDSLFNTTLPQTAQNIRTKVLYHKTYSGITDNTIAGNYYGYAIHEYSASTSYKNAKVLVSAEGEITAWIKDGGKTITFEALLPSDTLLMTNIYTKDEEDNVTPFISDTVSTNKKFHFTGQNLDFKVKDTNSSATLKSIKFNLIKKY
jgi:hypothetical protein